MKSLFLLCMFSLFCMGIWAEECPNTQIKYKASEKLSEITDGSAAGLHTNAFNVAISNHEFTDGVGTITFNGEVTTVGEYAFRGAEVTEVTLPSSITTIGKFAFYKCEALTTFTIPAATSNIDPIAFTGSGLTSLTVASGNATFSSPDGCNAVVETATGTLVLGSASTTIPSTVTKIGEYAFDERSGLATMNIPTTVTEIGEGAFWGCEDLETLTLPEGLTTIGGEAFYGCSITTVTIPSSVTSIGMVPFGYCSELKSLTVASGNTKYDSRNSCNAIIETATNTIIAACAGSTIPDGIQAIGEGAFMCTPITSLSLPSSVESIGDYAFSGCENLTVANLSSVKTIGEGAFEACEELATVTFGDALTSIGDQAFVSCHLTSVTLPNSLSAIGKEAFASCGSLTSVALPNSLTEVGEGAFGGCTSLESVTLGTSMKSIPAGMFQQCTALTTVNIPAGVEEIGGSAFWSTALTEVTLPSTLKKVDDQAFSNCLSLATIKMKSLPEFGIYVFDYAGSGYVARTFTLELTDSEHPFYANTTTNAPTFTSVKYIRSLAAGKYGTIVLPFVPANASDFKFYSLKSANTTTLTFAEVETVEAGVPYIYRNADDTDIKSEMAQSSVALTTTVSDPSEVDGIYLKGAYQAKTLTGASYYALLDDNKFHSTSNNLHVYPFRAYIEASLAPEPGAKISIEIENEATSIDASLIEGLETLSGDYYDLNGRKVANPQKGIYIKNGKKVIF